ncbi:hypothetical protein Psfp_03998 [Pelotomaculum sp. FP]|uniref:hypothetical protein n=1 Tax=Pelotomaculum sp. FP TaxID=261474 RepID=UPI0011019426|nr:hypothetical protein [Pelotomaculum sp. FP]TEB11201.1 hypothetical protein Psfp_03998 [Pelotomaculum sp. FP]
MIISDKESEPVKTLTALLGEFVGVKLLSTTNFELLYPDNDQASAPLILKYLVPFNAILSPSLIRAFAALKEPTGSDCVPSVPFPLYCRYTVLPAALTAAGNTKHTKTISIAQDVIVCFALCIFTFQLSFLYSSQISS